jgi:TonB family protein
MRPFAESVFIVSVVGAMAGPVGAATLPSDKQPEPPAGAHAPAAEADYLRALHAHIHRRWTDNFLRLVGESLPLSNPLNDAALTAEVDVTVAVDGQLLATSITKSSGFPGFDDAIIEVLRDAVPFPHPVDAVRSDDDKLHLHWLFARDERRCSGVVVMRANDPLEIAIPKLLRADRGDEIVERVAAARAAGTPAEPMMTQLAREWLKQSIHRPWMTVRAVRGMAEAGDPAAVAWLKLAVKDPDLAGDAGEALIRSHVPVCPLVKAALDGQDWKEQQNAAAALATAGDPACAAGLIKLLANTKASAEARTVAAVALGPVDTDEARQALATAARDDKNPGVRGAAMLAQVRPGAGRGKVLAMVQYIRDPVPEIRAAAAAGVVRAGGDSNLDDLYVLFKDSDPRAALASLRELDRLPTEKSTTLVAHLARRPMLPVQKRAAEILLRRRARGSFGALKAYLEPGTDPQLRGMALAAADDATLKALVQDPTFGVWVYRARLARGERDRAADWLAAHAPAMTPAQRTAALVEWLESAEPQAPVAAEARKGARGN